MCSGLSGLTCMCSALWGSREGECDSSSKSRNYCLEEELGFGCGSEGATMPRFMPVQCHKCSVLQIKPAQKLGLQWCCSMCRKPEVKVGVVAAAAAAAVSDVSLFVEELNLPQEAEEMGAVANTFRGVENLNGASNWEGLYFQKAQQQRSWKRVKPIEIYEDGLAKRAAAGEKDVSIDVGQRRFGSQQRHFLSSLWGRWHQKASNKDVVELMEFAGGVGNEENVAPRS